MNLLNPDGEGAAGSTGIPLPSYTNPNPNTNPANPNRSGEPLGPDPYYMGTAPVQLNNGATGQSGAPAQPQTGELPSAPLPGSTQGNAGENTAPTLSPAPANGNVP